MADYSSNTQRKLKVGISSFSENLTVLHVVGNAGIGTTNAQNFKLYVEGNARITGVLSATSFSGNGSGLTGIFRVDPQAALTTPVFPTLAGSTGVSTLGIATSGDTSFAFIPLTGNVGIGSTIPGSKLTVFGNASISGILTAATLSAISGIVTNITGVAATITNLTSTVGFVTNLTGVAATITTLNSTNASLTNITGTAATITTVNATTGTITNLNSTTASLTSVNSTNGTITNLTGTAATLPTLTSTTFTATTGTITNLNSTSGGITNLTGTAATITTVNATNGNITNLVGVALSYSGISTFSNGPVLIGSLTSTNTASQRLQVTGGAYVSGNVGIATTNPLFPLQINSGATIFHVNTNGDLGLGTATATSKLHVIGNSLLVGFTTTTSFNSTVGIITNVTGVAATFTSINSNIGIITNITGVAGTITSFNATTGNITSLVGVGLSYSGISTFSGGPLLIGALTPTGTASQNLQVTGGAFVSGNVGIATSNPTNPFQVGSGSTVVFIDTLGDLGIGTANATSKLYVVGDAFVSGIVTSLRGFNIGIQSAGLNIATGAVSTINFVGTGNSLSYDAGTRTVNVSIAGGGGGGSFSPVLYIIGGY